MADEYRQMHYMRLFRARRRAHGYGVIPSPVPIKWLLNCWKEWEVDPDFCVGCGRVSIRIGPALHYRHGGVFAATNLIPTCLACTRESRPLEEWLRSMRARRYSSRLNHD